MLALQRLPTWQCSPLLARGNATVQATMASPAAPPSSPAQNKPATTKIVTERKEYKGSVGSVEDSLSSSKERRSRQWKTSRPSITLERPRQYMRPIGRGVLPAYDLAVSYIKRDSLNLKQELSEVQAALGQNGKSSKEVESLQQRGKILEVQSEINLPSVRWKAKNGLADMSKPVYRRLLEQRWREEGPLDLLMERLHQMSVVPDLLPALHPSLDLRLNFPEAPPKDIVRRTRSKRDYEKVEPGIYLLPEQTRRPPKLYVTVFHTEPRLYTLLMVDLDVPDTDNSSFQTYLHWMQPNITLSSQSSELDLPTTHTPYIPPHPQRGTPYHRYVVLLLPQQSPTERIKVPVPEESERLSFDFRTFAEQYGLDGSTGGGAHMWREVWDPTVSHIYKETLKLEEPVFGRMPKPDPYANVKKVPKYI